MHAAAGLELFVTRALGPVFSLRHSTGVSSLKHLSHVWALSIEQLDLIIIKKKRYIKRFYVFMFRLSWISHRFVR